MRNRSGSTTGRRRSSIERNVYWGQVRLIASEFENFAIHTWRTGIYPGTSFSKYSNKRIYSAAIEPFYGIFFEVRRLWDGMVMRPGTKFGHEKSRPRKFTGLQDQNWSQ